MRYPRAVIRDAPRLRHVLGTVAALSLACASAGGSQLQLVRARAQLATYHQYQVPTDYRERLEEQLERVLEGSGARSVMLAEPEGAIVCGHVSPREARGAPMGYLPFGAIFEREGPVRWLRVYQPFQGMYTTSLTESRATDDDVTIAIACGIPLVFR